MTNLKTSTSLQSNLQTNAGTGGCKMATNLHVKIFINT